MISIEICDEPLPYEPRHDVAIVTFAAGAHLETLALTAPLMQDYAERIGADFIAITDDIYPRWTMANKWRATSFAKHYKTLFWVDSDVIIKPDAPDILNAAKPGQFAFFNELPVTRANEDIFHYQAEFKKMGEHFGQDPPPWCPNAGIMVMPSELAYLYAPPKTPVENLWCFDQFYLALELYRHGVHPRFLESRWNHGYIDRGWWNGLDEAYLIHLNGITDMQYQNTLIKRFIAGNYAFVPPPAGQWYPKWHGVPMHWKPMS